jgi:hypothetical protein
MSDRKLNRSLLWSGGLTALGTVMLVVGQLLGRHRYGSYFSFDALPAPLLTCLLAGALLGACYQRVLRDRYGQAASLAGVAVIAILSLAILSHGFGNDLVCGDVTCIHVYTDVAPIFHWSLLPLLVSAFFGFRAFMRCVRLQGEADRRYLEAVRQGKESAEQRQSG